MHGPSRPSLQPPPGSDRRGRFETCPYQTRMAAPPQVLPIGQGSIYIVLHRNCETATMKNITVSVDEQTHRLARIRAAELDTSVSALVRDYLRHLAEEPDAGGEAGAESSETIYQRRCRLLREVLADFDGQGIGLRMSDNLPRETLYDRVAARAEAVAERERQRSISEALRTSPCDS